MLKERGLPSSGSITFMIIHRVGYIGCVSVPAKCSRKLRRFKITAVVIMKVFDAL